MPPEPPRPIDPRMMPLAFRWFVAHGLLCFKPWHLDPRPTDEPRGAREAFRIESGGTRDVIPFARRQDNDDTAGFEVIGGRITAHVIAFHPAWSRRPERDLIDGEYDDLWDFVGRHVLPDMKDWASVLDVEEVEAAEKDRSRPPAAERG